MTNTKQPNKKQKQHTLVRILCAICSNFPLSWNLKWRLPLTEPLLLSQYIATLWFAQFLWRSTWVQNDMISWLVCCFGHANRTLWFVCNQRHNRTLRRRFAPMVITAFQCYHGPWSGTAECVLRMIVAILLYMKYWSEKELCFLLGNIALSMLTWQN